MAFDIAPLKFKKMREVDGDKNYSASTPFGYIDINYDAGTREWRWKYCFDEYHDEDENSCDSLKDGKAKANTFWRERLMPALTPTTPDK